jgi:hypothetical protein
MVAAGSDGADVIARLQKHGTLEVSAGTRRRLWRKALDASLVPREQSAFLEMLQVDPMRYHNENWVGPCFIVNYREL